MVSQNSEKEEEEDDFHDAQEGDSEDDAEQHPSVVHGPGGGSRQTAEGLPQSLPDASLTVPSRPPAAAVATVVVSAPLKCFYVDKT